jgi:hypothetical protein
MIFAFPTDHQIVCHPISPTGGWSFRGLWAEWSSGLSGSIQLHIKESAFHRLLFDAAVRVAENFGTPIVGKA